jgi:hypothetical protein
MTPQTNATIQNIHDSQTLAAFAVAGAGSSAIDWLLSVAGASRTVLEIIVPYSENSFSEYIGSRPEQTVSIDAAKSLALAAYTRALNLRNDSRPVIGIACTATIATDRPKRGDHRGHVGLWTSEGWSVFSLTLEKGLRDRAGEEQLLSVLILRTLAFACGVVDTLELQLAHSEHVEESGTRYDTPLDAFNNEHISSVLFSPDGSSQGNAHHLGGVLSGSFNPLHNGHRQLVSVASRILGAPVIYELSVTNVDKPPLENEIVQERVNSFRAVGDLVITKAPVFYEKARVFPGCTFVIGWDTMIRLVDPKYYSDDYANMILALSQIRDAGCKFLVAGRINETEFHTLGEVNIPALFQNMFQEIPESEFRSDISSTEIRQASRNT